MTPIVTASRRVAQSARGVRSEATDAVTDEID